MSLKIDFPGAGELSPELKRIFDLAMTRLKVEPLSHHGPGHWLAVWRNGVMLARETEGADSVVAQLFGLLHDCERENEGSDPQHGPRAAEFVRVIFEQGKLAIDQNQLRLLCFACERHDCGEISDDPTIGVCWDSDRLELPRVGIQPVARLFSTKAGKRLIATFRGPHI